MTLGSFDSEAPAIELADQALPHLVCRYDPDASDDIYKVVPRLRCSQIQYKEGHEPPTAQFFYELDNSDPEEDPDVVPQALEDYWPGAFDSEYVVKPGDRLAVLAIVGFEEFQDPDPSKPYSTVEPKTRVLFDGFAKNPQFDMDGSQLHITFLGVGAAIRAWDSPIYYSLWRDSDDPDEGDVYWTSYPMRFNPDGTPNCTPDGKDYQDDGFGEQAFPVFLDTRIARTPDPRTYWTLDKAVMHILGICNGKEEYVSNPDFPQLISLLRNRQPAEEGGYIDPDDPSTYKEEPIKLRDTDLSGFAWPDAVARLLSYGGFGMKFVCEDDENGEPWNYLEVYRKDNDGPNDPKELNYPETGIPLDDTIPGFSNLHLTHDYHSVANEIVIETRPAKWEVSIVLAPFFTPHSIDTTEAGRARFLKAAIEADPTREHYDDYRTWVADECGDGHLVVKPPFPVEEAVGVWEDDPFDFSPLWPDDKDTGRRSYVRRYRPGLTHLFTKDPKGKPLPAQLEVSRDYAGPSPAFWDGTGTWQLIEGGYTPLKDRLGIRFMGSDPMSWEIGKNRGQVEPSGILDAITSLARPGGAASKRTQPFYLRLTTVIEGDVDISVTAYRRKASPIPFTVRHMVDAKDHFKVEVIMAGSKNNPGTEPKYGTDHTRDALTHAAQLRAVHEFPPVAGAFVIPNITFAFEIGDRISRINGRDISLKTNAGEEAGEVPTYPFIVAKTWDLQKQSTVLQMSDRRAEPPSVSSRTGASRT